ncbi:hypothetical protein VARIO8X_50361 [Burkholderiales bacterium 8X]|nr:hypothetical protein VARIO8X_50361 [Burkholderiales bacterium 8X]
MAGRFVSLAELTKSHSRTFGSAKC